LGTYRNARFYPTDDLPALPVLENPAWISETVPRLHRRAGQQTNVPPSLIPCAASRGPPLSYRGRSLVWALVALLLYLGQAAAIQKPIFAASKTRLGQPDGISPSRMAEMLEVDKAGPKARC